LLDMQQNGLGPLDYALQKKQYHLAIDLLCLQHGFQDETLTDALLAGDKETALAITDRLTTPGSLLQFMKIMIAAGHEEILADLIPPIFSSLENSLQLT